MEKGPKIMKNDIHAVTNFHPVDYLASRVVRYDQMIFWKNASMSLIAKAPIP
jgi:hypothetical protein